MSSTYRFLCLSHAPAIVVESWETSNRDQAVGLAERRASAMELGEHRGCRLVVGRYSYPLVEVYDPARREWTDVDVLRLLVAGRDAGVDERLLAPFARRGWDMDILERLRVHLLGE
jgi:hypothetical protein